MAQTVFATLFLLCAVCIRASEWTYFLGGADWEGTCTEGDSQSPINIPFLNPEEMTMIEGSHLRTVFEFGAVSDFTVTNNGHAITLSFDENEDVFSDIRIPVTDGLLHGVVGDGPKSTATTINIPAFLYNFHLHTPAEHAFDGALPPMEGHMVHIISKEFLPSCPYDTCLSVVGLRFVYTVDNENNPFIDTILATIGGEWPANKDDKISARNSTIDFRNLFPHENPSYAVYNGSLTTPPCTEYVLWHIIEEPLPVSVEQVTALERVISNAAEGVSRNSRTIQPLNGRTIGYVAAATDL
eukprot:TRINITY_DN695_c0_g1_i1.p2 TRINITY_DN695_c0_g1~~TRINITY_DN695_c0_g1_i1.p2  ORF type:complete len:298 (-),score=30.42 TRINITY_DN695_c0_g1_i1:388-1281(-)